VVGRRGEQPEKQDYPAYVETGGESARGLHAIRVLENQKDFTLDSLIAAAYDSYLTWFEKPIPALINAWDQTADANPLKAKTAAQIALLRAWDLRWGVASVPTSLAVFWGEDVRRRVGRGGRGATAAASPDDAIVKAPPSTAAISRRRQRPPRRRLRDLADAVGPDQSLPAPHRRHRPPFNDAGASIPVAFTSAQWGSLASFGARPYPATKKWYGTSGNSFVAVVEFGDRVRARAVTAGGESGDPKSRTSTIRRNATAPAICARSTSTAISSRAHRARIPSLNAPSVTSRPVTLPPRK